MQVASSRVPQAYAQFSGDRDFASTLARGLELLRCFNPREAWLGNKDFAQRLNLPPATVTRLTYTLVNMGFLVQAEPHGKYRLGSAVLSLGYPLLEYFPMRRQARPAMLKLAQDTGGSVSIGIRDRLSMVYIEVVRAHARRVYPLDVGTSQSLAGTALGRAYLMACSVAQREALLNQLRVQAPTEWARYGRAVQKSIRQFTQWGCCLSVGELYPDVQAVAVPLGAIDHGELASLNCSFQGRDLDEGWLLKQVYPRLQEVAKDVFAGA